MSDPPPLSALRILVPPLRLMSAFLWQVAQQQNLEHYGKLEEFVTMVTKTVPGLLSSRQRGALIMGLRAKMMLEMCRGELPVDVQTVRSHLNRIQASGTSKVRDSELESLQAGLLKLVLSLLEDPKGREHFFQEVFPVEYGPDFDKALQVLTCFFLSRLEQLFPVPSFKQVASWLSRSPSGLQEYAQAVCQPDHLRGLLQKTHGGPLNETALPSVVEDRIISSLSRPPKPASIQRLVHSEPDFVLGSRSPSRPEQNSPISPNEHGGCEHSNVEFPSVDYDDRDEEDAGREQSPMAEAFTDIIEEGDADIPESERTECLSAAIPDQGDSVSIPALQFIKMPSPPNSQEIITEPHSGTGVNVSLADVQENGTFQEGVSCELSVTSASHVPEHDENGTAARPQAENAARSACLTTRARVPWRVAKKCPQCGKCFTYYSELVRHLKSHALVGPCKLKLTSQESHKIRRLNALVQKCPKCEQTFGSVAKWIKHQKAHQDKASLRCSCCGREFKSLSGLLSHKRVHDAKPCSSEPTPNKKAAGDARPGRCRFCGGVFPKAHELRSHLKTHAEYRPHQCDWCGKCFACSSSLLSHLSNHTGEKPHLCTHCGKQFFSKSQLKSHLKSHSGERPHCCAYCGKRFSLLGNLTVHTRIHTGEKPFRCGACGKGFVSAGDLQVHARSHTGEKPYRCKVCERAFVTSSHLAAHTRMHTGERPHCCKECGKTFTRRYDWRVHTKTHAGIKPFTCSVCARSYTRWTHLKRHMKSHAAAI
uniref:C2H2-type domain-containing protein n=3 Tax=Denticeps clupeoides TaxID=299321 RepID=A0AAY4F037_9TELE